MNEFIVWDNIFKVFLNPDNTFIDSYGNMYRIEDGDIEELNNSEHSLYKNIGSKDINGKSIYADSSIVEFDYKRAIKCDIEKRVCYFVYCNHGLKYWLKFAGDVGTFEFDPQQCKNFKIIDTIQENKLGLIK